MIHDYDIDNVLSFFRTFFGWLLKHTYISWHGTEVNFVMAALGFMIFYAFISFFFGGDEEDE